MKKAVWLAALLAVSTSPAYGQATMYEDGTSSDDGLGISREEPVYLKPLRGQDPTALELARLIRAELESSRQLNRVDIIDGNTMELEAPVTVVKDGDGKKMTITFALQSGGGIERSFSANCPVSQPERCADAVIRRAERMAREAIRREP